ncbi:hypothetical protein EB796_016877 [Bugula neritina]|uniref:Uncharacterized protein n=1 Tax=Bugula neritina TaxID=10212 RepID=A0A7J7JHH3_BUGNE|nr:hypothetical protein EB796_016877 [Bugula neritina]
MNLGLLCVKFLNNCKCCILLAVFLFTCAIYTFLVVNYTHVTFLLALLYFCFSFKHTVYPFFSTIVLS